jgi:hypothetical protein
VTRARRETLVASPYAEPAGRPGARRLFVPHSGRTLRLAPAHEAALRAFARPAPVRDVLAAPGAPRGLAAAVATLRRARALVEPAEPLDRQFRLEHAQIDPNTSCNERCVYCPVSLRPRRSQVMSMPDFRRVLVQLRPYRATLRRVALSSYNEPTLDPHFLRRAEALREEGLPLWLISNGSGLTPAKTDALLRLGVDEVELNIPSVDPAEYRALKGVDDLALVLRNTRHLLERGMKAVIHVHGRGDAAHAARARRLRAHFRGRPARVLHWISSDRAGHLGGEWKMNVRHERLGGCRCNGSRVINWVHINARGDCFLCCQDFAEKYQAGNVFKAPLAAILAGDAMARYRRWVYGVEEAPKDFLCRTCVCAVART